jgi:hypothetical protein
MDRLAIPNHPGLTEAIGRLAIAHTHLELILRYTVKTLAGLSVKDALDATNGERTSDVRRRIRRLFVEKRRPPSDVAKLDAFWERRGVYLKNETISYIQPGQKPRLVKLF